MKDMLININSIASKSDIAHDWYSILDKIEKYKEVIIFERNKPVCMLTTIERFKQDYIEYNPNNYKAVSLTYFKQNVGHTTGSLEFLDIIRLQHHGNVKYMLLAFDLVKELAA